MLESLIPPEWVAQVRAMQPQAFWFASAIGAAVAVAGLFGTFRFLHRIRMIEDTPTSKVRSAAQGYVELVGRGKLMEGEPILAPLTGTVCTWYRYRVEREDRDSKGRSSWRTLRSGSSDELFLLEDDTGRCVIDPEGAEVTPRERDVWRAAQSNWYGAPPRGAARYIGGRYRYTEERMHPGDPLYAIGLFKTVGGSADLPDAREELKHLLAEWKRDRDALLARFDSDGDGQIDLQEWQTVRKAAAREVARSRAGRAVAAPTNLLLKPTDRHHPFLLSVLPQGHLVRRLRWFTAGALAAFAVAGTVTAWMQVVRFGG